MMGLSKKGSRGWRLGRASRRVMRVVIVAWMGAMLWVLVPGRGLSVLQSRFVHRRAHAILGAARSPEQLRAAVGQLGAFYALRDGSWVAIRYSDQHGMMGYSCATACDSAGRWYGTTYHFCGRFAAFRQRESELKKSRGQAPPDPDTQLQQQDTELFALANAPNLDSARAVLFQLGFTEE